MLGALVGAALLAVSFVYCIVRPVYNYFRDKNGLRRYSAFNPLCGITNFAYAWEVRKGFRSKALLKAHQEQKILRLGPNSLSFGDPRAIKDIYGHGSPFIKDDHYLVQAATHFHLADVISKEEHQRKRKVLSSAYALKNLESWEHKVTEKVEKIVTQFDRLCTAPLQPGSRPAPQDLTVDYRMWTNFFTVDAIADIGLSEKIGFLDRGTDRVVACGADGMQREVFYRESLHASSHSSSKLVWSTEWFTTLKRIMPLLSSSFRRWAQSEKDYNDVIYHLVQKRLARWRQGEKLDDFFTALLEDKNGTPNQLEFGEIKAEIGIMMNAGSDTTAIAMTNALYHLLKNPTKLSLLRNELASVLGSSSTNTTPVSYESVRHLPYLRAVLDESLRLTPPTAFGLMRKAPPGGALVCSHYIPSGTACSVSAYVAHRDPEIFPNPEAFVPERWLGEQGKELQPFFIAFSAGARGCIGRNISYLEQMVLLATMLTRYEFALEKPGWEIERVETFNLFPGEMWVKIWRRGGEEGQGEEKI